MMKKTMILVTMLLLATLPIAGAAQPFDPIRRPAGAELIPDQYIVVLNEGVRAAGTDGLGRLSATYGVAVKQTFQRALNGGVVRMNEAAARALAADPAVAFVEQDALAVATDSGSQNNATWGLDRVDQRELPLDGTYNFDFMGTGVDIYILDSGIRISHADFNGRASIGFDAIGDGQNGDDCHGHGTHVAGTAGSATWGVAKGARLIAVRVLGCTNSGPVSGVVAGIDFVASHASGPSVANMSLGVRGGSLAVDNAVDNAVEDGIFFAVSAGNDNREVGNTSPARAEKAFAVTASTIEDARSFFSNFGSTIEIFAPGSSVTSTWNTSDSAINTISGTSMASPHVAGAAALILEQFPHFTPQQVADELISWATTGALTDTQGSSNRLLFTRCTTSPDIRVVDEATGETVLNDGVFDFGSRRLVDLPLVKSFLICNEGESSLSLRRCGQTKCILSYSDHDH